MLSLEHSLLAAIGDACLRLSLTDVDYFSIRLARCTASGIASGETVEIALRRCATLEGKSFFTVNRGKRDQFIDAVLKQVHNLLPPSNGLLVTLRAFKHIAERDLAEDFKAHDETSIRSHLQTHLGRTLFTRREVPTGKGKIDLLVGPDQEVIEVKVWKDATYYQDGLLELAEYLRTEDKAHGYYVVVDFETERPFVEKGDEFTERVSGKKVAVLMVRMPVTAPSRLGREQRRARRRA